MACSPSRPVYAKSPAHTSRYWHVLRASRFVRPLPETRMHKVRDRGEPGHPSIQRAVSSQSGTNRSHALTKLRYFRQKNAGLAEQSLFTGGFFERRPATARPEIREQRKKTEEPAAATMGNPSERRPPNEATLPVCGQRGHNWTAGENARLLCDLLRPPLPQRHSM